MHRIDAPGQVGNLFVDGNPGGGIAGTLLEQHWHNAVQEELARVVETKAGIALVKGTWDQVSDALDMIMQGVAPGGRLTLETGVGVSTADQAAKTTVYYTPHRHNRIAVYDGTQWAWRSFTELSQLTTDATKSPAAVANNSNYDVFAWLDAGTLRATRGPAWSTDTARGVGAGTTELEFFEGKWVNKLAITNGPAARCGLYLGTIRSDGAASINDTAAKRHVWNAYNRAPRPMLVLEATDSWAYLSSTLRQANASTANQLDCVVGLIEDAVSARVIAASSNTDAGASPRNVGIGIDSTTVDSSKLRAHTGTLANLITPHEATYDGHPGLGRHLLVWLEQGGGGVGATTWYGDNGGTYLQSGIAGRVYG